MANIVRLGGGSGGGAKIGVTLNDDGTQNLFITETGDLPDLAAITADADAEAEDVLYGKTFYSMGVKKVGSLTLKADLLWENPDQTVSFAEQDVVVDGDPFSAYLVEGKGYYNAELTTGITMIPKDGTPKAMSAIKVNGTAISVRYVSANGNTISFGSGGTVTPGSSQAPGDTNCIPTRIWGVNFTL